MNSYVNQLQENKNQKTVAVTQKRSNNTVSNYPANVAQMQLQEIANNSTQVKQALQLRAIANSNSALPIQKKGVEEEELQMKADTLQRKGVEEEELQMKAAPIQRKGIEEEEAVQGKFVLPIQKKANNTGLPDNLKSGIENLSGFAMDDVKVHYNSAKPAQLQAHAYAQGTDIHLGSGQEKHLPHEAWHVVQQKQGRVQPTMQMKGNINVNDDAGLENEADVMGEKALSIKIASNEKSVQRKSDTTSSLIVQRQVPPQGGGTKEIANTNYQARGGGNTLFDKTKHPRSTFSFGTKTREAVLENFNPQYMGNSIISAVASHGEQVNVGGLQLDHQISWDTISNTMDTHNKKIFRAWDYTLWDAKMYYNDIDNLVPALGSLNASAGAQGVNKMDQIHNGLQIYQAQAQTAWMNLQAGLVAIGHQTSDENAERIAILLHEITTKMIDVTEELL